MNAFALTVKLDYFKHLSLSLLPSFHFVSIWVLACADLEVFCQQINICLVALVSGCH